MIIEQKILCRKCRSVIDIIYKEKRTNVKDYMVSNKLCFECMEKSSKKRSETIIYSTWIYPILERDNFTCTICNKKNTELHVHHTKPFIKILEEVLEKYNITRKECDDLLKSDFESFIIIVKAVVNAHELCHGISVCPECHGKIDKKYRRKK